MLISLIAKTLLYSVSPSDLIASTNPELVDNSVQITPMGAEIGAKIGFAIAIDTAAVP